MNYKRFKTLSLIFTLLFTVSAYSKVPLEWSGNMYKIIYDYNKVHKKFFKNSCGNGEDAKYYKLLKKYRSQSNYLPKYKNDIDRHAIKSNLIYLKRKKQFIAKKIQKLVKLNEYPVYGLLIKEVEESIHKLLKHKKDFHYALTDLDKKKHRKLSRNEIHKLKNSFKIFSDQLFFLKSYGFPNDFLKYRKKYEDYKNSGQKKLANKTFFYRKIIEDGAYDPNHTRPDKYIRSTMDTLFLNIHNEGDFLTESIRYDIEWFSKRVKNILKRGKKIQISRLKEWKERTDSSYKFYKELIKIKNKNKAKFLVAKENEASQKMKEFVYSKQAKAYEFWSKQSVLNKALYSLETILYNEVGVIDGPYGLERSAVAKVVLNRYFDSFYNQLDPNQWMLRYINPKIETKNEKWLNVLFRIGEFSFTYHYIPAVVETFCPSMTKRSRKIRNKNLKISLKAIKSFEKDKFEGMRYFSRISMLGKIDMSSVWSSYSRLPEMVGYESSNQRKLLSYYLGDKYEFLYTFTASDKTEYTVIKTDLGIFAMKWSRGMPRFYDYRDPQLFAYFKKK